MKDQLEALVAQMHQGGILYSEAVREFKKRFIINVLQQNKGNQCKAARELGMHRNTLSRTINELKLDVRQFRQSSRPTEKKPPQRQYIGAHSADWDTEIEKFVCACGYETADPARASGHDHQARRSAGA